MLYITIVIYVLNITIVIIWHCSGFDVAFADINKTFAGVNIIFTPLAM